MKPDRLQSFTCIPPVLVATVMFLLLTGGCVLNQATVHSEPAVKFKNMVPAEEAALGGLVFRQLIQKGGGRYPDKTLSVYVDSVGQRLVQHSQLSAQPFNFALINDSELNAFALPGGYVAITRGLLLNLSDEAELAAILGHEIAHVVARHNQQGVQRGLYPEDTNSLSKALASATSSGWLTSPIAGVATDLIAMRFSLEQEAEADRLGIDYMLKAGYDPDGAVAWQEYFQHQFTQGGNPQRLNGLSLSHPFSTKRLAETRQYVAKHDLRNKGNGQGVELFYRAIEGLKQTQRGYATYDLARQAEAQGDLAAAIAFYHSSLLEAPAESLILCRLGLAYLRQEDLVPARRYLIKAINLQDDYYQSRLGLGYIYQQKKQYKKAQEQLEAGFNLLPTREGAYLLAEVREQNGDIEGARALYAAVAKADPQGKLGHTAAARLKGLVE